MAIFDEGVYSISEASEHTNISVRTMQRLCKTYNLEKQDGGYLITGLQLKVWMQERAKPAPNDTTRHDTAIVGAQDEEEVYTEDFTPEQYNKLQEVIEQYPIKEYEIKNLLERLQDYKNEITYLKKHSDKILEMHQRLIDNIDKLTTNSIQRNTIEAKEKDVINPDTWKPNK